MEIDPNKYLTIETKRKRISIPIYSFTNIVVEKENETNKSDDNDNTPEIPINIEKGGLSLSNLTEPFTVPDGVHNIKVSGTVKYLGGNNTNLTYTTPEVIIKVTPNKAYTSSLSMSSTQQKFTLGDFYYIDKSNKTVNSVKERQISIEWSNEINSMQPYDTADEEYFVTTTQQYEPYLTFTSDTSFKLGTSKNKKTWNKIEYSKDATTWKEWDGGIIYSGESDSKNVLFLRGTGNATITVIKEGNVYSHSKFVFYDASNLKCIGNIETLLDYQTVLNGKHPQMTDYCYWGIFADTPLTQAPEMPSLRLAYECYAGMYSNCKMLKDAPKLPAAIMAERCYEGMFYGCASLTIPPELPAKVLAPGCYNRIFDSCTSLIAFPALCATTLYINSYEKMFYGCNLLKLYKDYSSTNCNQFRIPKEGTGVFDSRGISGSSIYPTLDMVKNIGATPAVSLSLNTVYYTPNEIIG